jgi:nanoRNase/pAp phosphatase (c-di-AMP/oligoRNAs hydrolase)
MQIHPKIHDLLNRLKSGDDFVITTHKGSDPDGIGSELALDFLL